MKYQDFVNAFETAHMNYKLGLLSHVELLQEIALIDEKMREAGFDVNERSDAHEEGEKRVKEYFKNK